MKGSLIIVGAFVVGSLFGLGGWLPEWLLGGDVTMWILYALMLQVGIGIGCDERLKEILRTLSPRLLILPCATIVGTLVAVLAVSFLLSRWTTAEVMAVGSGMGYYSLSSILITSLKEPSIGVVAAAELGTIAFGQYFPRDNDSGICATHGALVLTPWTHQCGRSHFDGCDVACHHPFLG